MDKMSQLRESELLDVIDVILYSLRFKIFDTIDFLAHVWPFVLLKRFVKYVKLYVYMKVYLTMNHNMKRINNYLNFLNKTNGQTRT